ncbi:serine/threonine-protein kinase [Nonomuraea angiospora]|uniref:serine/threonine-protein kinase n=1 Tax=Nonomuraea angiospora TaxID=46172 RepID=UPI0029A5EDBE|nr:serine/threonine-protein kinase [Nonomuraea angiospora]MDX3099764.1 serine/threonine-protein kinase [Nonomuraea angiospora]
MSVSRYEGWLLAGRYRLQSELGRGGMGRVWRGHDELLDRPVAVKEVTLDDRPPSEREALLSRTMSEARLAARLSHPHIASVYDVVEADERPWIVLQLVSAPTLAGVLAGRGPLPPAVVARIGLQMLDALQTAHAAGIVHRDVKPANILLEAGQSHAVLTDFGLATSLERPVDLTGAGVVVGTPAYISPERARGGPPTPQTDLWSLGVTLYAAVEGRPPFEEGGALATISAVLTADPAPFERAGPLAPLLAGLLHKDPERRMSIGAARRHLEQISASPPDGLPQTGDIVPAAVPATGAPGLPSYPGLPETNGGALPDVGHRRSQRTRPPGQERRAQIRSQRTRPPGQERRAQLRHVAVAAALAVGALAAGFWADAPPGPPAAAQQPSDRLRTTPAAPPATPAPEPTTTAATASRPGASQAQQVSIRRRAAHAGAPAAQGSVPPGQAKKATTVRGHIPPGHSAEHPGRGKGKGNGRH